MAWPYTSSPSCCCICYVPMLLLLLVGLAATLQRCHGFATFGFDMHHMFSDPVKEILAIDNLPEKGSLQYYITMAHRDKTIHGRRLAAVGDQTLTFSGGNETYRLNALGFLHYANVSVGTPSKSFLVALDTGSDLLWIPCNCTSCVHVLKTSQEKIEFDVYGFDSSTTSKQVFCNNSLCELQNQCVSDSSSCPYQISYLSNGTSSSGILVEDVLHLITDDGQGKAVDARVTFGCGQKQTGSFLDGAAPNGLFGLGIRDISVPSILAKAGLTSNSFSMCFGPDGVGRITFGENGTSVQRKTPLSSVQSHPTYNIIVTQISVGGTSHDLEFSAIFDSGTSFTYLNDPAYTLITESFNSIAIGQRHTSNSDLPFDLNQTSFEVPFVNLTMKGGDQYFVADPIILVSLKDVGNLYCVGVLKSGDVNIIGQNFMTGYRVVFDLGNMLLGWKESDCYSNEVIDTVPFNPSRSPAIPPATAVNPEATSNPSGGSATLPPNHSHKLNFYPFTYILGASLLFTIF